MLSIHALDRQGITPSLILDTINRVSEVNSVFDSIQSRSEVIPCRSRFIEKFVFIISRGEDGKDKG